MPKVMKNCRAKTETAQMLARIVCSRGGRQDGQRGRTKTIRSDVGLNSVASYLTVFWLEGIRLAGLFQRMFLGTTLVWIFILGRKLPAAELTRKG
jgi:hypothetical protein